MVLSTTTVMEIIYQVAEDKNMKVTVSSSVSGGLATGGAATLGGLLMGPMGLAVGGTVGGLLSAFWFQGEFQSVVSVIKNMDPLQRQLLISRIQTALSRLQPEDLIGATVLALSSNQNLQQLVIKEITNHLTNSLKMNVIC